MFKSGTNTINIIASGLMFLQLAAPLSAEKGVEPTFEQSIQPLLDTYCYRCHGEEDKIKGDVDLTPFQTGDAVFAERDLWLEVLEQIETEEMPTKDPLPSRKERQLMLDWLNKKLNDLDWAKLRHAGHVTIPRLNKTEYNNTMRDLLGIDIRPGDTFLKDGEGLSGFTTDRDNLFITPLAMEKYFTAAERALDAVIALEAEPVKLHYESEEMFMTESDRVKSFAGGVTGYELNRGQMTLYESIDFPNDGYYRFTLRALSTVSSQAATRLRIDDITMGDFIIDSKEPTLVTQTYFVTKGSHQVAFNHELSPLPKEVSSKYKRGNKVGSLAIDWIDVTGPIKPANAPKQSLVFHTKPGPNVAPEDAAQSIIEVFALRAFRRPVEPEEARRYFSIYKNASDRGAGFGESIKLALTGILVSPNFLFRHELSPEGQLTDEFALNNFQIASRLSYFLWMSMPDRELFVLANEGKLSDPEVLRAQVRRMVIDPKARSFTSAFLGEWLGYQSVGKSVIPDAKVFPEFDAKLADAMKAETILTFEHLINNNHSLASLLDVEATFLNQRLATHYGIDGVKGEHMRPIVVNDPNRGGLLGMASVLTATSSPTRTSPVLRGKWVLETLLGEHIPEPPADAGQLDANAGSNEGLSLRQELEMHRDHSDCRSCHDKIDPIGFGLENFDAIGRHRTKANGMPIDSSGQLEAAQNSVCKFV